MATPLDMSPEEAIAMQLVWEKEGHAGLDIPHIDQKRILAEIRDRVTSIETQTLRKGLARFSEGRKVPRRHQRVALLIITVLIGILWALSILWGALVS